MRHPASPRRVPVMLGAAVLAGGVTATALAGCTAPAAPPAVTETIYVTETQTVTVTPTPPPPAAAEAEAPDPDAPPPSPNDPAPVYEWGAAYDNGPRPGANAVAEVDETGEPERYVVVAGDSFFDIAQRFDLPQQQLLRMNPQIYDFGETVYIGQVINLDWQKEGVG